MVKRLEQRAQAAHLEGDDSDPYLKIDKTQRSRLFCDWLVASLGQARLAAGMGVVDVAGGGKGDMAIQLWIQRGIPTTLIDPVRQYRLALVLHLVLISVGCRGR